MAAFARLVQASVPPRTSDASRLRQALVAGAFGDYMRHWSDVQFRDGGIPGSDGAEVAIPFGRFLPREARFVPSWRTIWRELRRGCLSFGASLLAASVPSRRRYSGPLTLLIGMVPGDIERRGSDAKFVEFCRNGPVYRLHRPARLLVQHGINRTSDFDAMIHYACRPLYEAARASHLGLGRRCAIVLGLFAAALAGVPRILRSPREILLLRDRFEAPLVRGLVGGGALERIIYTNSLVGRQPTWMREGLVPTSMLWYSENNKWIWDDGEIAFDHPAFFDMCIDEHWVWTREQASWLRCVGEKGDIHVVGPILWYLQIKNRVLAKSDPVWLTVFDVTPVTESRAAEIGYIDNYFSPTRWMQFIDGIVEAVQNVRRRTARDIRLRMKPKRRQPQADASYARHIDELVAAGVIEMVDSTADLFQLTSESALAIVQPFSSPAIVAVAVGTQACYFDPEAILARPVDLDARIAFVQTRDALEEVIGAAIK